MEKLCVLGVVLKILVNGVAGQQSCVTPDGKSGTCIGFRQCSSIMKLISQYSNGDQNALGLIWQSVCNYGNGNGDTTVCCGSDTSSDGFFSFAPLGNSGITDLMINLDKNVNFENIPAPSAAPPQTQAPPYDPANDNRCGVSNASHTRVVGGRNAERNAYPWIAALLYAILGDQNNIKSLCGGSLITKRHVLTAAHCVKTTLQSVMLGGHDISNLGEGIIINVASRKVHEDYDARRILNDIALLSLTNDVQVGDTVRPICLPLQEPQRSMDLTGYQPFVAGWGTTSSNGPSATILQEVQVPVVSTSSCESEYKLYFPTQVFDNRILCAGATGKDSCQGDSGGPLMFPVLSSNGNYYYYVLIGIVSYGYECGTPGFPGVYTRVTSFLPWIMQNIQN